MGGIVTPRVGIHEVIVTEVSVTFGWGGVRSFRCLQVPVGPGLFCILHKSREGGGGLPHT